MWELASVKIETIYIYLLEEGTDVWRPCKAEHLGGERYRILDEAPEGEVWEFKNGTVVKCRMRELLDGAALVAMESAD